MLYQKNTKLYNRLTSFGFVIELSSDLSLTTAIQ